MTGCRIGMLRDDKGGEYISGDFDLFLTEAGIRREHTIRDTPQQNGVAEPMNHSIAGGVTTLLAQSGLTRTCSYALGLREDPPPLLRSCTFNACRPVLRTQA